MPSPQPPPPHPSPVGAVTSVLLVVIVVALVGYGAVQVATTHAVDKYLIGGLVILALAFAGYGGDRLLERLTERFR